MQSIHPIFHVSILEPSTPNFFSSCEPTPDPLVYINGEPEYEISKIVDSWIDKRCKCKLLYLVQWTGYEGTDEETSWLPASKLGHADEVVLDIHEAYPAKPGPLPLLEFTH
jgi:hypothetical protein